MIWEFPLVKRWVATIFFIGLALFASVSILQMIRNNFVETGAAAVDLKTYWYYNHFIREGKDPYQAYHEQSKVSLPVNYLDGAVAEDDSGFHGQSHNPAWSPPMMFLLLPLAYFSWPTAKVAWMLLNLIMALGTPWLVSRLLPNRLSLAGLALLSLVFYGMIGTRVSVAIGQSTILVFVLMLITYLLVRSGRKVLPGVLLGIALSKFSLAIPLLILLLYRRQWTAAAVAFLVQLLGFVGLAFLRQGSPLAVFLDWVPIVLQASAAEGIHLTGLFPPNAAINLTVGVVFTIAVFVPTWVLNSRHESSRAHPEFIDYALFAILCLWSLLAGYHRPYDTVVEFLR